MFFSTIYGALVRVSHDPADGWARVAWIDSPARDAGDDLGQEKDGGDADESV